MLRWLCYLGWWICCRHWGLTGSLCSLRRSLLCLWAKEGFFLPLPHFCLVCFEIYFLELVGRCNGCLWLLRVGISSLWISMRHSRLFLLEFTSIFSYFWLLLLQMPRFPPGWTWNSNVFAPWSWLPSSWLPTSSTRQVSIIFTVASSQYATSRPSLSLCSWSYPPA